VTATGSYTYSGRVALYYINLANGRHVCDVYVSFSNVAVAMEAYAAAGDAVVALSELGEAGEGEGGWVGIGTAAASDAGGSDEVSTGDSLTSCDDDLSTIISAEETEKLERYQRPPSSPAVPRTASSSAADANVHTLAPRLPSALQLCKVHALCLHFKMR